jgi:hypothetical protein
MIGGAYFSVMGMLFGFCGVGLTSRQPVFAGYAQ